MQPSLLADLDELILLCGQSEGKPYIAEAVACYKAGSFRACVLATWVGLVFDYIGKLRQLAMSGDANATQEITALEVLIQANNVVGLLQFERGMLLKAKDNYEFITPMEYEDLARLGEDRHRCAHPAMNSVDEPYSPSAETARYHIKNAVSHMIQRPPAHGKVVLEKLISQIESTYFSDDPTKAITYLKTTPLIRPRYALLRNFIVVLLKKMLVAACEDILLLFRYIAAFEAILSLHHSEALTILDENAGRVLANVEEKDYRKLVTVVFYARSLWSYVPDHQKIKLGEYTKFVPKSDREDVAWIVFDSPHFHDSTSILAQTLDDEDITSLMNFYISVEQAPHIEVLNLILERYWSSTSFAAANNTAKQWIIPFAQYLNEELVGLLLVKAKCNSQVLDSKRFRVVLRAIFNTSETHKHLVTDWLNTLEADDFSERLKANVFSNIDSLEQD